jgi:hypothetical protein
MGEKLKVQKWDYLEFDTQFENGRRNVHVVRVDRVDSASAQTAVDRGKRFEEVKDFVEIHYSHERRPGGSPVTGKLVIRGEAEKTEDQPTINLNETQIDFTYPIKHTLKISPAKKPEGKKFGYDPD